MTFATMEKKTTNAALERIRAEFNEMNCLVLTPAQIARLCGLEQCDCDYAIAILHTAGFLRQASNNTYLRAT